MFYQKNGDVFDKEKFFYRILFFLLFHLLYFLYLTE